MKRISVLALLAFAGLLISSITFAQPGDIPTQQPVIHARVESRTVDGLAGQSCWPKTDGSDLCNFPEDPEPTAPVAVFQGQTLAFVIEPDAPAPQKFTAVLLDDAADKTERDLLATKGEFDFSALKLGRHRLKVIASYPGDVPDGEYFVTYVFLLQVENPPTPTPTPSPTVTPSPTATPLVPRAVLQQSVRTDRTAGVLIFSVQTENEELIKSYRLNIVAASGELVKQIDVDTPPYDEIRVPFADLPGGSYNATLSALDANDKVIAQGSQISFTYQPPTPTATPTEVPTQTPTETAVALATPEATGEATQAATAGSTQAATQPGTQAATQPATQEATQAATAAITGTATPVATAAVTQAPTEAGTAEPTRGATLGTPQPVTITATPVVPTPLPTNTPVITPSPFSPTAPPTVPSATPIAQAPATATPSGPTLALLVGGTEFDPFAVTECDTAGQCQTRVLEPRFARAITVPGAVSQITFRGPRPTAVTANLFTGDLKTLLNAQRLPADNVVLYIMPAAPGNYVLSVELGVPEGTLTFFFRLLVGN